MKLPLAQLATFLNSHGWTEAESHFSDRLRLFRSDAYPRRELALPSDANAPDFEDAISAVFEKLAGFEKRTAESLVSEAARTAPGRPVASDEFVLRIKHSEPQNEFDNAIPLDLARASIVEAEVMLMVGSCQAQNPERYYRRVDNRLSSGIVERALFNHTRYGSFVITISCPVVLAGEQFPIGLDAQNLPPTRRALLSVHEGLTALHGAVTANRQNDLVHDLLASKRPLVVSANMAESIANIAAFDTGGGIDVSFQWSPLVPMLDGREREEVLAFSKEHAERLYAVARQLRPEEESITARFVGTVEALRGDVTDTGLRAGSVEFALLHPTSGLIRASAKLSEDMYKIADKAHIGGAQFVAITGTLEPRARVWVFSAVEGLELVRSP